MRQIPNGKRSRNRPGRGHRPQHHGNNRNQTFDSSGPEGKVRGTANQVYEKYLALARDASSSGDRVTAENFFQHAEHYFRIMVASGQQLRPRSPNGFEDDFEGEGAEGSDGQPYLSDQPQPQLQPQPQPQGNGHQPRPQNPAPQPQPQASAPQPERRPETPAELAQAAAANSGERERDRERGRRGGRRGNDAAADA